jgi:hypothetical protein
MLTKDEASYFQAVIVTGYNDPLKSELLLALDRETDKYAPNRGTDVIAKGPNKSSTQMLDEAARALGWRTDWACGDSPITWDLVLTEIRKLKKAAADAEIAQCESIEHDTTARCVLRKGHMGPHKLFKSW